MAKTAIAKYWVTSVPHCVDPSGFHVATPDAKPLPDNPPLDGPSRLVTEYDFKTLVVPGVRVRVLAECGKLTYVKLANGEEKLVPAVALDIF